MNAEGRVGGDGPPSDSSVADQQDAGHPARVFLCDVTPADALAWERLPSEATGWRKVGVFAPWVAVGMVWGASGDMASLALRLPLTGGAGLAVMLAAGALTARARARRARSRVPAPCRVQVEEFGDHLALRGVDPPGPATFIAPETIRQIVLARGHVFLEAPPDLMILPLAAFEDAADMAAFAAVWQDKLRDDDGDRAV